MNHLRTTGSPPRTMKGTSLVPPGQNGWWELLSPTYSGEKQICLPRVLTRRSVVPGGTVDLSSTLSIGSRATALRTWLVSHAPSSSIGGSKQMIEGKSVV